MVHTHIKLNSLVVIDRLPHELNLTLGEVGLGNNTTRCIINPSYWELTESHKIILSEF